MSEDGEMWDAMHKDSQKKRKQNVEWSTNLLKDLGIHFKVLNSSAPHYRVGNYDFWPSTGLFYDPITKERGRGVKNLIKKING